MTNKSEKVTEFMLEDGRRAERKVFDDTECEGVQVTEISAELPREKTLVQRVTEKRRPVVYERETEHIDQMTGEVIEKVIESTDPRPQMHVLERHVAQSLSAQSVVDEDCAVTRKEMKEGFLILAEALKKPEKNRLNMQAVVEERIENKKI